MTREEARNHLAEWLDKKMWRCFGTIDREAISIAVEALSPRRREDATEEDYAYCSDCEAVEMCMWYPYDGCIFKVRSRPKGEWNKFDTGIYLCSNCNWAVGNEYNYCPCCGARMENKE